MRVLVLYDTRSGFTEKCVGLLAAHVEGHVDARNIADRDLTWITSAYDAVVLGGPVYRGRFRPGLLAFARRHQEAWREAKQFAVFAVSLSPKAAALEYLKRGLLPVVGRRATHLACFGGGITWERLTWLERWSLRRRLGVASDVSNLALAEIQHLAAELSKA